MMLGSTLKSWQFYSYSLIQLLIEPGLFFKELAAVVFFPVQVF